MTRGKALLALLALGGASFVAFLPAPVEAAQGDLQLITQNFNIAADGSLTATISMPAKLAETDLSTALFAVTVGQRVNKREDIAAIISGTLSRPDDTVAISPVCCLGPAPGQYTFSIPLEVAEVRPDALSIPRTGLYPVTIAVQRDGRILSKVLTFLHRLPAADEGVTEDPISVAFAIGTHSAVHLDSKATTSVDPTTAVEMNELADALDALDAHAIPATVRIAPGVLNGLQQLDPALFARLVGSLQRHQVIAEPEWPIDPSAAAAVGQEPLYTSWLRDGEERLAVLGLGPAVLSRSTIFVDQPVTSAGAVLRRNLGAALMVMTPEIYDGLDGTIGAFSDFTGELIAADLPNNTTFDAAVVDHTISQLLVRPMSTPEQTRVYIVAHLLALRQKIETAGASLQRHAVLIATPDLGVPDAALLGPLATLIAETPGLSAATVDEVALRTDRLLIEGEERLVTLPTADGDGLEERIFTQGILNNEIDGVASMLPDGSERPGGWRDLAALLPTTALDDAAAQSMVATIRAELTEIRDAIQVPAAYTVNLPGKRSTVRIRFVNNSDVPLKIRVQLTSPSGKLVFENPDQPIELPPGVTNVPVEVDARSNGTSGVSLDVFMPNDVALGGTVPLKFRVNAVGVGNVLTIAVFGLVLLWWLQHARSAWRKRRQLRPATLPVS